MLKDKFISFWKRICADGDPEKIFALIESYYMSPERFYHNLDHISHCLDELVEASMYAVGYDQIEFAVWFHDIIYDTRDSQNEERSAEMAYEIAHNDAGMDEEFCEDVRRMIMASKHDVPNCPDNGINLFLDIDLSVLGGEDEVYARYRKNIRKEYGWVTEHDYRVARKKVLTKFVEKEYIYRTDFFRSKYEKKARLNIAKEIEILERA